MDTQGETDFYNYVAIDNLIDNIDNIDNIQLNNITIKINAYEIKNNGTYPFLKYLLYKDELRKTLFFPLLQNITNLASTKINSDNIITLTKLKLFSLLQPSLTNYSDFDSKICFKGFFLTNDQTIHIFFDLTQCKIELCDIYKTNKIWFVLLDEIVNYKNICGILIDSSVTNFFVNNDDFIFLKNQDGDNFEIPIIGYTGMNGIKQNNVSFVYTYGNSPKDKSALLGPYYYFTDFKNSIRQGGWSEISQPVKNSESVLITDNEYGRYIKGSIVRFALFLGKIKNIENFPNDDIDFSETKKNRINDANLDKNMEILTMRISDHDGKWAENYDSVFLGEIELDNGANLKNTPIYVVKTYEQQIPLSYHFIDKSYLHDYCIM
jgi:hypothetical protein